LSTEKVDLMVPDREVRAGGGENQPFNPERDPRKNIEINLGKACNNRCVFCLDGMPKREDRSYMPWETLKAEIDRWSAAGHRSLGFLGGEPTTYPNLPRAVAYARAAGFSRIAIATNATKLRLSHFTDKVLEAGLTRVTVSMHGHTAELEDRLTRVPGNFEKKCTALRYLLEKKQEGYLPDGLSVNIVLNGWNAPHLLPMMRFFYSEIGLDDLRVNFVRPEGYAEGSAELTPRYPDVVPVVMKAVILNERHFKKTFTLAGFPLCVLPKKFIDSPYLMRKYLGEFRDLSTDCSVRADGEDNGISRFEEGRSRFNWQDRKRYDLKGHPSSCDRCAVLDVCEGVWGGYLSIYGDEEFHPLSALKST